MSKLFVLLACCLALPLRVCAQDTANLRTVATKTGVRFGTSATSYQIKTIPEYAAAIPDHFNHLASDWELHWGIDKNLTFRPERDIYNFYWLDEMSNFAANNDLTFEGHHLVWGNTSSLPEWLLNGQYTKADLLQILKEHIVTVVSRYRGKVDVWTVVNEPFGYPGDGGPFWHERLGPDPDWIDQAFLWADSADPDAVLLLNDAGMEFPNNPLVPPERYEQTFALVTGMKQRGVPIDGIGFQMHLNANDFAGNQLETRMKELAATIRRYRDAGLDVYITELDIRINEIPGTVGERYAVQAALYRRIIKTALTNGVKQINTFGLTDEHSWYEAEYPTADATLLSNYQPKPSYAGAVEGLKDYFQTRGDANRDVVVDGIDYVSWVRRYGTINPSGPSDGDFNEDGKTDGTDYTIWLTHYGR